MVGSIVDVAKVAGVSHSTVSRVINNRAGVSAEAVEKVRAAMDQLGYAPAARRPGRKPSGPPGLSSGNIGLIMMGERATFATAPVAARVFHSVEESLTEMGFNLIVCQPGRSRRLPPIIETGQIDGLLLHGAAPDPQLRKVLSRQPSVWMLTQRSKRGYWGDRVCPDNEAVGRLTADYLTGRGLKSLVQLTVAGPHLGFGLRHEAFAETAEAAGASVVSIPLEGYTDKHDQVDEEYIDRVVDKILALGPRPVGVFVPRDRITVLVHRALRERDIEPDRDVVLVSCDNDPILSGLDAAPATIDIRADLIARRAVEQLQWRMQHPTDSSRVTITVEPRLVEARLSRRQRLGREAHS